MMRFFGLLSPVRPSIVPIILMKGMPAEVLSNAALGRSSPGLLSLALAAALVELTVELASSERDSFEFAVEEGEVDDELAVVF